MIHQHLRWICRLLAFAQLLMSAFITSEKINQKLFVDADAISFVDAQKQGLLIIMDDNFVKNYLQEKHLPTVFVSAIPLSKAAGEQRVTKVLYPEIIQEGKMITLDGLRERSWYYACVEFENFNRHNQSTGTTCRKFRTLDKFGKTADSTVVGVKLIDVHHDTMTFDLGVDVDFPLKLTVYLSDRSAEAKTYVVSSTTILNVHFDNLEPEAEYGKVCIIEQPLSDTYYSTLGRRIGAALEQCYLSSLKTKSQPRPIEVENQVLTRFTDQNRYALSTSRYLIGRRKSGANGSRRLEYRTLVGLYCFLFRIFFQLP